jgi:IS1 family transposase
VGFDPEHRLVVTVVPGKRTAPNAEALLLDFKARTAGRAMNLITTDEYFPYRQAILKAYGRCVVPPPTGRPGRPRAPRWVAPPDLRYATVHKTREKGRVVKVETRVVFGCPQDVQAALKASPVSRHVNTAFVERHNGTDRNRNARKVRKTYCFSKDWDVHEAVTYYTMYSYNFCWPVRTLAIRDPHGNWRERTAAMSAGLTDHVWSLREWLAFPAVQRE